MVVVVVGGGGALMHSTGSFMKGVGHSRSLFFLSITFTCLRSFRSKYNASTINYLLVYFSTLRPQIKWKDNSLCKTSGTNSPYWLGVRWEDRLMGRPRWCWNDGIVSAPRWLVEPLIMLHMKYKNMVMLQPWGSELRSCVMSWATVPNKPTVSVDVKQHSTSCGDMKMWLHSSA